MFILQLSHADVIAIEAFRTGSLELALYSEADILFFMYKIDGIFKKDGWGDCPLGIQLLPPGMKPILEDLQEPVIHFYLVDADMQVLLAQRTVTLTEEFFNALYQAVKKQLESSMSPNAFCHRSPTSLESQNIFGNEPGSFGKTTGSNEHTCCPNNTIIHAKQKDIGLIGLCPFLFPKY